MTHSARNRFAITVCSGLLLAGVGCQTPGPTKKEQITKDWDQQRAALKLELAGAELRGGRLSAARTLAQEAVALNPDQPAAHEILAQTYIAEAEYRAAEQILATSLEKHPAAAQSWYLLGTLHERQREWDLAASDYDHAAAAAPDKLEYVVAAAQTRAESGDAAAAIQAIDEKRPQFGSEPAFHVARAEIFRKKSDLPSAIAAYRDALRLGLEDDEIKTSLGLCLQWSGENATALEFLGPIVNKTEKPDEALTSAYASALLANGQPREAAQFLQRTDLTLPNTAPVALLRAQALAGSADFEAALRATQSAVALQPAFADAWLFAAGINARLGRKDAALECAERCLRLDPKSREAWTVYVQILDRFDERVSAAAARDRLKSL